MADGNPPNFHPANQQQRVKLLFSISYYTWMFTIDLSQNARNRNSKSFQMMIIVMFGLEFDSSFSLPVQALLLHVPPHSKPIRIGELVCTTPATQVKDIIQALSSKRGSASNASQRAKAACETVEERSRFSSESSYVRSARVNCFRSANIRFGRAYNSQSQVHFKGILCSKSWRIKLSWRAFNNNFITFIVTIVYSLYWITVIRVIILLCDW